MENDETIIDEEINDEEEKEVDELNPEAIDEVDELQKKLKTAIAQKKHWRKKATQEIKKPEEIVEAPPEVEKPQSIDVNTLLELQAAGHSPADIKNLSSMADSMKVSIDVLMENETFMAGFNAKKQEEEATNKTPVSANRTIVHKNKTFKEIVTDPESSKEDKQIAFENKMKSGAGTK